MTAISIDSIDKITVAVTGGGSGGHTSTASGIVEALWAAGLPHQNLFWIGSYHGVEARVTRQKGIRFFPVSSGKLRRYLSFENLTDLPRIAWGGLQSLALLRRQRPDVLVSTGGFVSLPVTVAAWLLRIPIIVHEQTLAPGLANRLASRLARRIILTFPESRASLPAEKCTTIGNPLRSEVAQLPEAAAALQRLGLDPGLPLLYITGGAQGSNAINQAAAGALPRLLENWQVIHQYGTLPMEYNGETLARLAGQLDPTLQARYHPTAYIADGIADIFAAARLIVSRSGAATINEIIRLGLPALLIPLPGAAAQEQLRLSQMLERAGAARVLLQPDLTPDSLLACIDGLSSSDLAQMRRNALALAPDRVEERLAEIILKTAAQTA